MPRDVSISDSKCWNGGKNGLKKKKYLLRAPVPASVVAPAVAAVSPAVAAEHPFVLAAEAPVFGEEKKFLK